jgi:aryl-alcohol dehydrogenase-like predicted oxidoreductase
MGQIGLGLAALGRPEYINIRLQTPIDKSKQAFRQNAIRVLDEAYANGVRFFDSAPSYGKGEVFLMEWNALRKYTDVTLSTKWGYTYVANWELGYKGSHEIKEHSLDKLLEQWEVSKTLVPNLKIYQIHSATLESGVLENKEVLEQLLQIKKETEIQIGLTVSGPNQKVIIEKALSTKIDGNDLFDSYQVTYNIFEQDTFSALQLLKKKGKLLIIKEGLANGRVFTTVNPLLKELSIKYNVGIDAIALRFCLDSVNADIVLSGASDSKQLIENLKANSFVLVEEDISKLKRRSLKPESYWYERSQLTWD